MSASERRSPTRYWPPPVEMPLHRVERAVSVGRLALDQRPRTSRPPRVRDEEPHDGDCRLVRVLLEEHPLEHLRALVAVLRHEARPLAEVPEDRARLGKRPSVVEHERRHSEVGVEPAEHLAAGSSGRRRRGRAARTGSRGGRGAAAPCSNCPRPASCRGARPTLRRASRPRGRGQPVAADDRAPVMRRHRSRRTSTRIRCSPSALVVVPVLALARRRVRRAGTRSTAEHPAAADILNPHPAAGPFAPDETRVEDCRRGATTSAAASSRRSATSLTARRQASAGAHGRDGARPTAEIKAGCHRIAHTVGAAVLAREDGNIGAALADGDSTCWSGFYHGLLERALAPARSTRSSGTLIATLCDPSEQNWPPFTHYQCLHGLGHGLMLRTGYALDASLDMCTRLPDEWSRQSCDGGVFMESFSPSLTRRAAAVRRERPARPVPCASAEDHKLYCYLQVADNLVRGTSYDWAPRGRRLRHRNERRPGGRSASRATGARPRATTTAGRRASRELCSIAGVDRQSDCVYGAARDIASNAASGRPAATFCRLLASGARREVLRGRRHDPRDARPYPGGDSSRRARADDRPRRRMPPRRGPAA